MFVDGCLSAVTTLSPPFNDMAYAYGMGSDYQGQIYIGWRIKVLVSTGITEKIVGNTTEGVRMFWDRMGRGDDVYEALYYTSVYGGGEIAESLWGLNGTIDIGNPDEDDNIFCWGDNFGLDEKLDP